MASNPQYPLSASDTMLRRKQRVLFADKIIQETAVKEGLRKRLVIEGGQYNGAMSYQSYLNYRSGAVYTTEAELQSYINSVAPTDNNSPPAQTAPDSPTDVSASPGNTEATISFTPPVNDGGSAITSYTVTSSPEGLTVSGASSPLTLTGLTNGTSYTFTVTATNAIGTSTASSPSSAVTPSIRVAGNVKLGASFYDNTNLGYVNLSNPFSKICADSANNIIVGGSFRSGTLTINKPDTDGITQISVLSDTFNGATNFVQTSTYYTYNLFVTKYSSATVPQWSATIAGDTNIANTFYGLTTDSSNNVYALVAHGGSVATPHTITFYNADGSAFGTKTNIFGFGNSIPGRYSLIKYNSSGQIQWINSLTAGDNNNQYCLLNTGSITIDSSNNIYISCQVQRAGGGTGPTALKLYQYGSVSGGVVQDTLVTVDSYAFGGSPAQYHRGYLIKLDSSGNYTWMARMVMPTAWGENNGGTTNSNIVVDSSNNVYICLNGTNSSGPSSPICNIYSGVSTGTNPIPTAGSPYYRIDLRGNSISPSLPQYYTFAAIVKFDSDGAYQRLSCAHQLRNGSNGLNMNPSIGINPTTNTLYMVVNAQGFSGTNGAIQLDTLYVDSFSSNTTNGSNYDIVVSNTFNQTLTQPQQVVALISYDASLQAQAMTYIDTPSGNSISPMGIDSSGNLYLTTTIQNTAVSKTIYTFDTITGATPSFATFGTVTASNSSTDGLVVSYSSDLRTARWATTITSSDGYSDSTLVPIVDSSDYIYVGGVSLLNNGAATNTIALNSYDTVSGGAVQTTLFGNIDVTPAIDLAGFLIKYE